MNLSQPLAIEAFALRGKGGKALLWHPRIEAMEHEEEDRSSRYITLRPPTWEDKDLADVIAKALRSLAPHPDKILVVGLGNPRIASDSLGAKVTDRLAPSPRLVTLTPDVEARTGISSARVVGAVAKATDCDLVVAVDTLACATPSNLVRTIQLSDRGSAPGHGLGNRRKAIDKESVDGVVLSVGVPLIAHTNLYGDDLCVTPTDVERVVERCAATLAEALGRAWT